MQRSRKDEPGKVQIGKKRDRRVNMQYRSQGRAFLLYPFCLALFALGVIFAAALTAMG